MPPSRINPSATANCAAAFKQIAPQWRRICASSHSSLLATHIIRKRCFGSRCHKAAPDHSRECFASVAFEQSDQ